MSAVEWDRAAHEAADGPSWSNHRAEHYGIPLSAAFASSSVMPFAWRSSTRSATYLDRKFRGGFDDLRPAGILTPSRAATASDVRAFSEEHRHGYLAFKRHDCRLDGARLRAFRKNDALKFAARHAEETGAEFRLSHAVFVLSIAELIEAGEFEMPGKFRTPSG